MFWEKALMQNPHKVYVQNVLSHVYIVHFCKKVFLWQVSYSKRFSPKVDSLMCNQVMAMREGFAVDGTMKWFLPKCVELDDFFCKKCLSQIDWILSWEIMLLPLEKALLQTLNWKGFFPEWVFMCLVLHFCLRRLCYNSLIQKGFHQNEIFHV